ncbi:MAG: hypothetical protein J1E84_02120 [Muribaculaceae bacterium]|nr:hypothetical protein [Muribaculaceae bacterium]
MKSKLLTIAVAFSMAAWMGACSSGETTKAEADENAVEATVDGEAGAVDVESALKSEDTNEVLGGYNALLDRYNDVVEKIKNGDTSLIDEFNKLTELLNSYKDKLEGLKGSMTEEQAQMLDNALSKAAGLKGAAETVVSAIKGDANAKATEAVEEAKAKAGEAVEEAKAKAGAAVDDAKAKAADKAQEAVSKGVDKLKNLK